MLACRYSWWWCLTWVCLRNNFANAWRASITKGCSTSKSTSTNNLMRPANLIRQFGLIKGKNGAIRLLRLTDLFSQRSKNDSRGTRLWRWRSALSSSVGPMMQPSPYGSIREKVTSAVRTLLSVTILIKTVLIEVNQLRGFINFFSYYTKFNVFNYFGAWTEREILGS